MLRMQLGCQGMAFSIAQENNSLTIWLRFRIMVFNAPFYNISVISWWSVLLVEETRVP